MDQKASRFVLKRKQHLTSKIHRPWISFSYLVVEPNRAISVISLPIERFSQEQLYTMSGTTSAIANYYLTNPKRLGLLGHISFGVQSYSRSRIFYTAILAPLGAQLVYDNATRGVLGYGFEEDCEIINIFECKEGARPAGNGSHVAFNAPSRKAVREFWEAGVANGGVDGGGPGLRTDYGEFYYAAFLLDPDGFKLEAVFQQEEFDEV